MRPHIANKSQGLRRNLTFTSQKFGIVRSVRPYVDMSASIRSSPLPLAERKRKGNEQFVHSRNHGRAFPRDNAGDAYADASCHESRTRLLSRQGFIGLSVLLFARPNSSISFSTATAKGGKDSSVLRPVGFQRCVLVSPLWATVNRSQRVNDASSCRPHPMPYSQTNFISTSLRGVI